MTDGTDKTIHVYLVDGPVVSLDANDSTDTEVLNAMESATTPEGFIRGPLVTGPGFAVIPARSVQYCVAKGLDARGGLDGEDQS